MSGKAAGEHNFVADAHNWEQRIKVENEAAQVSLHKGKSTQRKGKTDQERRITVNIRKEGNSIKHRRTLYWYIHMYPTRRYMKMFCALPANANVESSTKEEKPLFLFLIYQTSPEAD